jgi:DNA-binding transcriptional regulator YiaG
MMDWSALSLNKDSFRAMIDPASTWSMLLGANDCPDLMETGVVPAGLIEEIEEEQPVREDQPEVRQRQRNEDDEAGNFEPFEDESEYSSPSDPSSDNDSSAHSESDEDELSDAAIDSAAKRVGIAAGQETRDISDLLELSQSEAATALGMRPSTLCKRWKEAVGARKWPFRALGKIDKDIAALRKKTPMSRGHESRIAQLRKHRREILAPATIRLM